MLCFIIGIPATVVSIHYSSWELSLIYLIVFLCIFVFSSWYFLRLFMEKYKAKSQGDNSKNM